MVSDDAPEYFKEPFRDNPEQLQKFKQNLHPSGTAGDDPKLHNIQEGEDLFFKDYPHRLRTQVVLDDGRVQAKCMVSDDAPEYFKEPFRDNPEQLQKFKQNLHPSGTAGDDPKLHNIQEGEDLFFK